MLPYTLTTIQKRTVTRFAFLLSFGFLFFLLPLASPGCSEIHTVVIVNYTNQKMSVSMDREELVHEMQPQSSKIITGCYITESARIKAVSSGGAVRLHRTVNQDELMKSTARDKFALIEIR